MLLSVTLILGVSAPQNNAMAMDNSVAVIAPKSQKMLIPVGRTAGIKLFADGVLVVGISDVNSNGTEQSPARDAGLQAGDVIISIDSKKITSTESLKSALQASESEVKMLINRAGKNITVKLTPVRSDADDMMKLGAWVRDSMAGIGTITYFDPETGIFGALGHGINDVDTGSLMPLSSGSLVPSVVSSVRKGEVGSPGELSGSFDLKGEFGSLFANTERGIFGKADAKELGVETTNAYPVADKSEIKVGPATILTNVEGDKITEYQIEIKKILLDGAKSPRDMTIEITDSRLIDITGGIVQGMSGSPIIQDGKIVGAVTHVLINEPTRGYAIFIENMLAESVAKQPKAA